MTAGSLMPELRLEQSHITRHTSHVTRHTQHATRHTPHATRHTPHATRHTPHATRHTPHATRHTSHATRHAASDLNSKAASLLQWRVTNHLPTDQGSSSEGRQACWLTVCTTFQRPASAEFQPVTLRRSRMRTAGYTVGEKERARASRTMSRWVTFRMLR
jgi:hypothetical protein